MRRLIVILSLAAWLSGCSGAVGPTRDTVTWSANLRHAEPLWRAEAAKRIAGRPVMLIVHGGDRDGRWVAVPDRGPVMPMDGVARLLKDLFPGRPVVILSCNPGGHQLRKPGVWYATANVWSVPDAINPLADPADADVGSIYEFTLSGGKGDAAGENLEKNRDRH